MSILYCKDKKRSRPYIVSVSGIAGGSFATGLVALGLVQLFSVVYFAVLLASIVILWIALNAYFYEFNGYLVRIFGKKELREKQLVMAREIVNRLYDRNPNWLPDSDDDDLIMNEAAAMFSEYFWRSK